MFKIPCRCGAKDKSFQKNIGPFFVDLCCEEAGFDHFGNPPGTPRIEPVTIETHVMPEKPTAFDLMTVAKLQTYCTQNKIHFTQKDNKTKLIERIKQR